MIIKCRVYPGSRFFALFLTTVGTVTFFMHSKSKAQEGISPLISYRKFFTADVHKDCCHGYTAVQRKDGEIRTQLIVTSDKSSSLHACLRNHHMVI